MANKSLTQEQLLAEVEDLLRSMPDREILAQGGAEGLGWLGRAAAIIEQWDMVKLFLFNLGMNKFNGLSSVGSEQGFREMMVLLYQARTDLRMRTLGPTNVALPQGRVFDYFDEIRKAIELASQDVLFVDPYLDAEFVSRYLPHVRAGVTVRLLTSDKRLGTLLPAVDLFARQGGLSITVRSTAGLHDRYIFVDEENCYQSGASFKDGAKQAPTTLTQITDAFGAVWDTYQKLWSSARIER
jgi:hypothetical protein